MVHKKPKIITLFGPTASGKTALAILLANTFNGVVINADSRQLYKHMPIITAMPSTEEFTAAPHMLFDILEPHEKISVSAYVAMVKKAVDEVISNDQTPIICGGTGFYLQALMHGMSDIPATNFDLLKEIESEFAHSENQLLWDAVNAVDPVIATKLNPNDKQRLLRALCVYRQSGKPLSYYQALPKEGALDVSFVALALNPDRETLRDRIDRRFSMMIDAGVVNEIANLKKMGFTADDHGVQSVGVREFMAYSEGKMSLDTAKELMLNQTKQYAKRQQTWLNGQYKADMIFSNMEEAEASMGAIRKLLNV